MVVEEATTLEDTTSARSSTNESVDICLQDVVICERFEKELSLVSYNNNNNNI